MYRVVFLSGYCNTYYVIMSILRETRMKDFVFKVTSFKSGGSPASEELRLGNKERRQRRKSFHERPEVRHTGRPVLEVHPRLHRCAHFDKINTGYRFL